MGLPVMQDYATYRALEDGFLSHGGRRLCWHNWAFDVVEGVYRYRECARCGKRQVARLYSNLAGVVNYRWVLGETDTVPFFAPITAPPKPGGPPA